MRCLNTGSPLLWVATLLTLASAQEDCRAEDGKPGLSGISGRDGLPGQKGEKGEPALFGDSSVKAMKGDGGSRGVPGEMGPKGYPGEVGSMGSSGAPGPKGLPGDSTGPSKQHQSAFSVLRTDTAKPEYGKPIKFDKAPTNINDHFSLKEDRFICQLPGVYYFVFHSMSTGNLCVAIKSDTPENNELGFCDYNRSDKQVLSGGVVLKLDKGKKVWLEVFKDGKDSANNMTPFKGKSIVFSGFLIFQNA